MPRSDDCAHAIRDDARPWRNSVPREGRVGANGIRGWHRPCPLMTVLSLISDGLPNSRFVQLASMSERADTRSLFQTVRLLTNRTSTLNCCCSCGSRSVVASTTSSLRAPRRRSSRRSRSPRGLARGQTERTLRASATRARTKTSTVVDATPGYLPRRSASSRGRRRHAWDPEAPTR